MSKRAINGAHRATRTSFSRLGWGLCGRDTAYLAAVKAAEIRLLCEAKMGELLTEAKMGERFSD